MRNFLPVRLSDASAVIVDDEPIGHLEGFRFVVDPLARAADRKLLLAAAERHLPGLLARRAGALIAAAATPDGLMLEERGLVWEDTVVARLESGRSLLEPRLRPDAALDRLVPALRDAVRDALTGWLSSRIDRVLAPLRRLACASEAHESGPDLRALLLRLVDGGGALARVDAGLDRLDQRQRDSLRRLGVRIGGLDVFVPAALRPDALRLWLHLAALRGVTPAAPPASLPPTVAGRAAPVGYRRLGQEALRVDLADRLLQEAHQRRLRAPGRRVFLDPARARSMGLSTAGYAALLRAGGFRVAMPRALPEGSFGPHAPPLWDWRPPRVAVPTGTVRLPHADGAFAALAGLLR